MTIYEIDQRMAELLAGSVNEETGELEFNEEELIDLAMERNQKVENLCCFIKNQKAFADALKSEKETIMKKIERTNKQIEYAESYLQYVLNGDSYTSARATVSYKKNPPAVRFAAEFVEWAKEYRPDLLTIKEPEPAKNIVKQWLKDGGETPYAWLESKTSMIIK